MANVKKAKYIYKDGYYVPIGEDDEAREAAQTAQESANNAQADAQAAQAAADSVGNSLKTYVRPNLLENWYFVGGGSQQGYGYFPLNSNGQTVYSSPATATIDRWGIEDANGNITVNSDSVTFSTNSNGQAVFWQLADSSTVQSLLGKTVTLSVLATSGLYSSTFTIQSSLTDNFIGPVTNINQNASFMMAFFHSASSYQLLRLGVSNNASVSLIAAKLELGSTQTLAHQENGVWVLNEVPSYGEEFSETVLSRAPYYYEDFSTTSRSSAWGGWYRGTADKYIGDRLPKLRAMFIIRAQDNIPAMVFLDNSSSYAYLVNAQAGKQMTARFVFER